MIFDILILIAASGGAGGLTFGLLSQNTYQVRLFRKAWSCDAGCIGDIIVGACAALAIVGLAEPILNILPVDKTEVKKLSELPITTIIKLVSFGIIGGFTGFKLLSGLSVKFLKQWAVTAEELEERVAAAKKSAAYVELGDSLI